MVNASFVKLPGAGSDRDDLAFQPEVFDELEGVQEQFRGKQVKGRRVAASRHVGGFENRRIDAASFQREATTEAGQTAADDGYALHVLAWIRARVLSR